MIDWSSFGVGAFSAVTALFVVRRIARSADTCQYVDGGLLGSGRCTLAIKPGCSSRCCTAHCRNVCRCDEPLGLPP